MSGRRGRNPQRPIPLVFMLACALVASPCTAASKPGWVALVIGNSSYFPGEHILQNAKPDAHLVAQQLSTMGFAVDEEPNLNKSQLPAVIQSFIAKVHAIGDNAVSFFYYSGHAAQDPGGTNFLIPTDATVSSPKGLSQEAYPLSSLLDGIRKTNSATNIVVLDACRDWFSGDHTFRIHDPGRTDNVVLAFSTQPNDEASDGNLDTSPYTSRLLENLVSHPHDLVSTILGNVDAEVAIDTEYKQAPNYNYGILRNPLWTFSPPPELSYIGPDAPSIKSLPPGITPFSPSRSFLLQVTNQQVSLVNAIQKRSDLLAFSEISTSKRMLYFLAAAAYQTGGFRVETESLNYTAAKLMQMFPRRFPTAEDATRAAHSPEQVANVIYSNVAGNGAPETGDGWRFRGRGLLQLTGKANYRHYAHLTGVDIETNPELVHNPEENLAVSLIFWQGRKLNKFADQDDVAGIAKAIEGHLSSFGVTRIKAYYDKFTTLLLKDKSMQQ